MQTRIIQIDPRRLALLEVNARGMADKTFAQLVANIQRDGKLTSVPFAAIKGYFTPENIIFAMDDIPLYEVLSGNHRVQAAIEAGLPTIDVMVTDDPLSKDQRIAIQLSHNSITGDDDPEVLAKLLAEIELPALKEYAALDVKLLEAVAEVKPIAMGEPEGVELEAVTIAFLPGELAKVRAAMAEADALITGDELWLARFQEHNRLLHALAEARAAHKAKSMSAALVVLLSVFEKHRTDLQAGWLGDDGEEVLHEGWVPLSSVLGQDVLPPEAAKVIKQAVDKMQRAGDISARAKWKALELWAADYLAG